GDVPVLAEPAPEVAPRRSERQDARAGQEVIERLFLDGIDAKARRAAVAGQDHLAVEVLAHEAKSPLARLEVAVARAQVALNASVLARVPPAPGVHPPLTP